ncbi:MAG: hypothetical protein ACYCU0_14745 [Solirubrobacteraceae bacterium]
MPAVLAALETRLARTMQMLGDVRERHAELARDLRSPRPRMLSQKPSDLILREPAHQRTLLRRLRLPRDRRARRNQTPPLRNKLIRPLKLDIELSEPRIDLREHATRTTRPSRHQNNPKKIMPRS